MAEWLGRGLQSLQPRFESARRLLRSAAAESGALPRTGRPLAGLGYALMPSVVMQGAPLAARVRAQVAADVRELGHVGLATVLVSSFEMSVDCTLRARAGAYPREPTT